MADVEKEPTIAEDLVVTKYKLAGEIVNSELQARGRQGKRLQVLCYVALTQFTRTNAAFPFATR